DGAHHGDTETRRRKSRNGGVAAGSWCPPAGAGVPSWFAWGLLCCIGFGSAGLRGIPVCLLNEILLSHVLHILYPLRRPFRAREWSGGGRILASGGGRRPT